MLEVTRLSVCALRFDLDVDRNRLADAGDRLRARSKHQVEVAPRNRIDRYSPARPARLVERCKQFNMKRNRFGHAVNGKVAENVAALRAGLFYASTSERDLRKFFDVKKLRAAQMIVSLFDARIDAADVDLRRNRGILRMLAVDFDLAIELRELSVRGA